MAQTGFTPISLYFTTTASLLPVNTNLVAGELAVNTTDERLYFKNTAGVVKLIGANLMPVTNGGTGVTTSTGSGSVVLSTSPTLVTPALGTPSALVGTNITGTATAFTASNVTTNANLTGAVTSSGNATSLGSFTSANLLAAVTDETGTGSLVFATNPTLIGATLAGTVAGGGNQINNVVIGASTPLAGSFTTLGASGAVTVTSGTPTSLYQNNTAGAGGAELIAFRSVANTLNAAKILVTNTGDFRASIALLVNKVQSDSEAAAGLTIANNGSITMSDGLAVTGALSATGALTSGGAPSATVVGGTIRPNGPNGVQLALSNTITSGFSGLAIFINGNGQVGSIDTSGSSTSYVTSSDYRLKNAIIPMTGALAKVALLKPVTYKWNVDGSDGQGFIAHELAEVEPGCVSGEKDATEVRTVETSPAIPAEFDAVGVETSPAVAAVTEEQVFPKYQGIDTSFLIATLSAAIQELHALVKVQAEDIADMKAKLS